MKPMKPSGVRFSVMPGTMLGISYERGMDMNRAIASARDVRRWYRREIFHLFPQHIEAARYPDGSSYIYRKHGRRQLNDGSYGSSGETETTDPRIDETPPTPAWSTKWFK